MFFRLRFVTAIAFLVAVPLSHVVLADEADKRVEKEAAAAAKPKADETKPAEDKATPASDAAKDKSAKKEKAGGDKAGKPKGLEALAAPLRTLFGGGAGANPVQAEIVVEIADDDPMVNQCLQQLQPVLSGELGFIRLICSDLAPEQRPKIKQAGQAGLKQAAKQMTQQQRGMGRVPAATKEPAKTIRDAISIALKETLTDEQMVRYTEEATKRTADRKKAAILCLVSRLDGQLFLTAEQRDKINDAISSQWQEGWEKWLSVLSIYGDRYFPLVPDGCVVPHLNSEQKSVWQGLQKIDFSMWFTGNNGMNQADDGWWGDEPEKVAAPVNGVIRRVEVFGS